MINKVAVLSQKQLLLIARTQCLVCDVSRKNDFYENGKIGRRI